MTAFFSSDRDPVKAQVYATLAVADAIDRQTAVLEDTRLDLEHRWNTERNARW